MRSYILRSIEYLNLNHFHFDKIPEKLSLDGHLFGIVKLNLKSKKVVQKQKETIYKKQTTLQIFHRGIVEMLGSPWDKLGRTGTQ